MLANLNAHPLRSSDIIETQHCYTIWVELSEDVSHLIVIWYSTGLKKWQVVEEFKVVKRYEV